MKRRQTVQLSQHDGRVDLIMLLQYLGKLDIDSLLLEGGGNLSEVR